MSAAKSRHTEERRRHREEAIARRRQERSRAIVAAREERAAKQAAVMEQIEQEVAEHGAEAPLFTFPEVKVDLKAEV